MTTQQNAASVATNCKAHPLGCRCHATPTPAQPPRTYWRLPSYVDVDVTPPAPTPRTGALDQLVVRIRTALGRPS